MGSVVFDCDCQSLIRTSPSKLPSGHLQAWSPSPILDLQLRVPVPPAVRHAGLSGKACKWKNQFMAQQHILQIAKNIHKRDLDIVQKNEVGDCVELKAEITKLQALGDNTSKPYLVRGKDSSTGHNAAMITHIDPSVDLKRTEQTASIPVSVSACPSASGYSSSKSVSKHFYTTFNVASLDKPVTVIGAHLLANPSDTKRCYEREAQAAVLAGLTNSAVLDGHHVILSGDLKDWSSTVLDHNNNKPISSALDILTGSNMVQVASYADKVTRYSERYDENNDGVYASSESSSFDHILVSNSLATNLRSVMFNNDITHLRVVATTATTGPSRSPS